jgi:hypothetical protein
MSVMTCFLLPPPPAETGVVLLPSAIVVPYWK